MLQDLTAAMIDHGLAKLRLDQLQGRAPMPGQVSFEELGRYCQVSPHTIKKIEAVALAKLYTLIHSPKPESPSICVHPRSSAVESNLPES